MEYLSREPIQYTRKQKIQNWIYYNKWWVLAVLAVAAMIVSWGVTAWRNTHNLPDYQFAYVGRHYLPDSAVEAFEQAMAAYGEDLNGDGQVLVNLVQYNLIENADPNQTIGVSVRLMADLSECESFFYLLEDPDAFQAGYQVLGYLDGSEPPETDTTAENKVILWSDSSLLSGLEMGTYTYETLGQVITGDAQSVFEGLYVGYRCYWKLDTDPARFALWEKIIQ